MSQRDLEEILEAIAVLKKVEEAGYSSLISQSDAQEAIHYIKSRYHRLNDYEKAQLEFYWDVISQYL